MQRLSCLLNFFSYAFLCGDMIATVKKQTIHQNLVSAGCPFAPRCSECMKICLNKMPPKTELSDTHYSYCWLLQKEALKGEENCE